MTYTIHASSDRSWISIPAYLLVAFFCNERFGSTTKAVHVFVCPRNLIAWFYVLYDHMLQFSDITGQHQEYATSQQFWDKNRCFQNTYWEWTLINRWLANPPPRILQETEFLAIIQGPYHSSTSFDIIQLRESLHLPIKIRSSPPEIRVDWFSTHYQIHQSPPFLTMFVFLFRFLWFPACFLLDAKWDFPTATLVGVTSATFVNMLCGTSEQREKSPLKKGRENWCIYGV